MGVSVDWWAGALICPVPDQVSHREGWPRLLANRGGAAVGGGGPTFAAPLNFPTSNDLTKRIRVVPRAVSRGIPRASPAPIASNRGHPALKVIATTNKRMSRAGISDRLRWLGPPTRPVAVTDQRQAGWRTGEQILCGLVSRAGETPALQSREAFPAEQLETTCRTGRRWTSRDQVRWRTVGDRGKWHRAFGGFVHSRLSRRKTPPSEFPWRT